MTDARDGKPRAASPFQRAVVAKITALTSRIRSVWLTPEQPFAFCAGQHVQVRLTAEDGYQAQRSYSIASAPEEQECIELAIERLEGGEVSSYFHEVAQVGDAIELRGPIGGHFVFSVADGGPVWFLAGGAGVVPIMAMLRHRAAQRAALPALLVLSARSWDELPFRDELIELESADPQLTVVFALTREPPRRSIDHAGRIDAELLRRWLAPTSPGASASARGLRSLPRVVYVCGANGFVEAAARAAITVGVTPATIRTERYGG